MLMPADNEPRTNGDAQQKKYQDIRPEKDWH
jgi:hypothetical protein